MTKITVVLCTLLLAGYVSWRWLLRDTRVEAIDAVQVSGEPIRVQKSTSRRLYFGSGHWGYGGGDSRVVLEFIHGGRTVRWEGEVDEGPRVLQIRGREAYVISEENIWDATRRLHLNFYAYGSPTGGQAWVPIAFEQFPPELAYCNLSLQGQVWRNAKLDQRQHLLADHDEEYVQGLLERLFR